MARHYTEQDTERARLIEQAARQQSQALADQPGSVAPPKWHNLVVLALIGGCGLLLLNGVQPVVTMLLGAWCC